MRSPQWWLGTTIQHPWTALKITALRWCSVRSYSLSLVIPQMEKRCFISFFFSTFSLRQAFLSYSVLEPLDFLSLCLTNQEPPSHTVTTCTTRLLLRVCIFSISTCLRLYLIPEVFDIQRFKLNISVLLSALDKGNIYETIAQSYFNKFCLSKMIQWLECPCF